MLTVFPIPAFSDNYIWTLARPPYAWVVDPGDAGAVRAALAARGLQLAGVLVTHHHPDHCHGLPALQAERRLRAIGSAQDAARIAGLTEFVGEGDEVLLAELELRLRVMQIPGHTLSHIAFHGEGLLFCGDTLFSAGCGRLFEGSPAQMHDSLQRLAALPEATRVYCGHEYTISNLRFAADLQPRHAGIAEALKAAQEQRADGRPTLPSTLAFERAINPFLRCDAPDVREAVAQRTPLDNDDPVAVFAALRRLKDGFRPPISAPRP